MTVSRTINRRQYLASGAAATLAAWPPVIIFFIFRKQFIEAIMAGALKGG